MPPKTSFFELGIESSVAFPFRVSEIVKTWPADGSAVRCVTVITAIE